MNSKEASAAFTPQLTFFSVGVPCSIKDGSFQLSTDDVEEMEDMVLWKRDFNTEKKG